MKINFKYQGRITTTEDISFINKFIVNNPEYSRFKLSKELCKLWNWVQANGTLRDQLCRSFMLALEREGYITLPPRRHTPPNPLANRKKPPKIEIVRTPIKCSLSELGTIEIEQVRKTEKEKIYNGLISEYHYLGYCHPIGEHLKYLVYSKGRIISCLAFSSAPRHIGSRDKFIDWDQEKRKRNIHLIAYNTRFLILPWVNVRYLASHVLSKMIKRISTDWQEIYNHPLYFLETFVDTERFEGTCYKAANWIYLGKTTGRGKNDKTNKPNRSIKAVLGYPLHKKFRELLNA